MLLNVLNNTGFKIEMALLSLYKPKASVIYLLEKQIERKEAEGGCYLGMVVLDQINVHFG